MTTTLESRLATQLPEASPGPGGASRRPRLGYRVVDMEMHHGRRSRKELLPYLPERYHKRWLEAGNGETFIGFDQRGGGNREDTTSLDGGPPATDPRTISQQLLDAYDTEYVVCSGGMYSIGTIPDADYAAALCRADNDWQIHDWLPRDPRYLGVLSIAPQDPAQATAEIERVGAHPRMVEVMMTSASEIPFGRRYYHPIYAAAEAYGLPIATHTTTEGRGITGAPTAAGYPSRYLEYHTNLGLNCMAQLASFVCEGVFARFPGLRLVMMEGGVSWVPPLLWRLDQQWKLLRDEVPHLKEPPSAYVLRQCRFGSQPIEEPNDPDRLLETWELLDAEHTVLFSGDYPHWDFDDPYRALPARTPERMRRRILRENARELFAAKLRVIEGDRSVESGTVAEAAP
jgi:predicted TIM-barrel fold metal-dependent hydrolase